MTMDDAYATCVIGYHLARLVGEDKVKAHGFASMVSGAGPCVLVLHHGDAREQLGQLASEELASGHWRVLHLGDSAWIAPGIG